MSWNDEYHQKVNRFLKLFPYFTGDELAQWMLSDGLPPPSASNQWGAAFRMHVKSSPYVVETGLTRQSKGSKSKGSVIRVWRSTIAEVAGHTSTLQSELARIRGDFLSRKFNIDEALKQAVQATLRSLQNGI